MRSPLLALLPSLLLGLLPAADAQQARLEPELVLSAKPRALEAPVVVQRTAPDARTGAPFVPVGRTEMEPVEGPPARLRVSERGAVRLNRVPSEGWDLVRVEVFTHPRRARIELIENGKAVATSRPADLVRGDGRNYLLCHLPSPGRAEAVLLRALAGEEPVEFGAVELIRRDPRARWPQPGKLGPCTLQGERRMATGLHSAVPLRCTLVPTGRARLHLGWAAMPDLDGPEADLEVKLWSPGTPPEVHTIPIAIEGQAPRWDGMVLGIPESLAGKRLTVSFRLIPKGLGTCAALLEQPRLLEAQPGSNALLLTVDGLHAATVTSPGSAPLIEQAAKTRRTIEAAGLSLPSAVAGILTGRSPAEHGLRRAQGRLAEDVATLPGVLAEAGFRTLAVLEEGVLPESSGLLTGFDRVLLVPDDSSPATLIASASRALAEGATGRTFVWVCTTWPAPPYTPDERARRLFPISSRTRPEPLEPEQRPRWDPKLDDGRVVRNLHRAEFSQVERALSSLLGTGALRGATWALIGLRGQNLGADGSFYEVETPTRALLETAVATGGAEGSALFDLLGRRADSMARAWLGALGLDRKALPAGAVEALPVYDAEGRLASLAFEDGVLTCALYAGRGDLAKSHADQWIGEPRDEEGLRAARAALAAALERDGLDQMKGCSCDECR